MSPLIPNYVIQSVGSALVAVLLWHYFRTYRQPYLRFWAISFTALMVALLGTLASLGLRAHGQVPTDVAMLLMSWLTVAAGYLQILALLVGVGLVLDPQRRLPGTNQLVIASALVSVLLVLPYADAPDGSFIRLTLRYGLRYLLAGLALLAAAILLMRLWQRSQLGLRLVSLCFFVFGLELAVLGSLNIAMNFGVGADLLDALVRLHGLLELLIYPAIGLGLVIWLLEQERLRAASAVQALSQLNRTDPLTGLANAATIPLWSPPAGVGQEPAVLAVLSFGMYRQAHTHGSELERDAVLQRIGIQLRTLQPAVPLLGRLAGDEFVLLWRAHLDPQLSLMRWCQQLDSLIARTGHPGKLAAHAGWVRLPDGMPVSDALPQARAALEISWQDGAPVCPFEPAMADRQQARRQIESEILQALERHEFLPYLQPIVEIASEQVVSFELLARWQHPRRGLLPPSVFIELLHQYQRIDELDLLCVRHACQLLHDTPQLRERQQGLSVNLSPQTLQRADLPAQMAALLRQFPINPARLTLEVTEYAAMASLEAGLATLLALREQGFGVAIDDFGTGYSSLTYLTQLPATVIKFDRAFIRDLDLSATSRLMLQTLVPLCHRLGKRVVAEGVETRAQWQRVREAGFDCVQGYAYAAPLPVDAALQLAHVLPLQPAGG